MEDMKDYFGKDAVCLREKKLFLLDMDGTIYEENTLFDGTLELLDIIKRTGGRYVFITNNSSKSVKDYVAKVNSMGIPAETGDFFTSAQATIRYLKRNYPGKLVYCQGTKSLIRELEDSGIRVTEEVRQDAGIILVGFDTELTTAKMTNTCRMLQRDIPFIATNPDLVCPVNFGFVPDCGSMCQMYENATGKKPVYIGKPKPTMVNIVMDKFGMTADQTVILGDRLYTDIAAGLNAGVDTVCVLTGEASAQDISEGDIKPTYTFQSVKDIYEILK